MPCVASSAAGLVLHRVGGKAASDYAEIFDFIDGEPTIVHGTNLG
ncbi:MAG TPA: hypothetical protein VND64_31005 [Pirellulales bacterium]|nr:hypothetical protein [Pirellulales bacterium]